MRCDSREHGIQCALQTKHPSGHIFDPAISPSSDIGKERRRLSLLLAALGGELENSLSVAARASGEGQVTLLPSADGEALVAIEDYGAGISLHEVAPGDADAVQAQEIDLDGPLILALHEATGRWLSREHGHPKFVEDEPSS